jgi:dTDP-glucose 4,6-dehydratase
MPSTPTPSADAGRVGGRAVVTGGAGFLGSWLCERLLDGGTEVVCVDNLATGAPGNLRHLEERPGFTFVDRDVSEALQVDGPVDSVFHLASPASPVHYLRLPIETMRVGSLGTMAALELAERHRARFLLASTSEVYGDPLVHPQPETYWGNVNPIGPRSVYDEAKRFSEALTMAYRRERDLDTGIVRIFNTYGPRMRLDDGRAIPSFMSQALSGKPITVAGDGRQTRSLCYVEDTVAGILALAGSDHPGPVNIGSPYELSMLELAQRIKDLTGSPSPIEFVDLPVDDPKVRRPDTRLAESVLGWTPRVEVEEGLKRTLEWMSESLSRR